MRWYDPQGAGGAHRRVLWHLKAARLPSRFVLPEAVTQTCAARMGRESLEGPLWVTCERFKRK